MIELKFKNIENLNVVANALYENGYKYKTFIIWKKDGGGIDCFAIHIEEKDDG